MPAFRLVLAALFLFVVGCAAFGASNGTFEPASAAGGSAMVYATADYNSAAAQQAAAMASIHRCDELAQMITNNQLPSGSMVNCRDAVDGIYIGPLYGAYSGYRPPSSQLYDFQVTEEWRREQAAAAERAAAEAAARQRDAERPLTNPPKDDD